VTDVNQVEKVTFSNKLTMIQIGVSALLAVIGIFLTASQYQANTQRGVADREATEQRTRIDRQGKQLDSFFTLSMRCASDKQSERDGMIKLIGIYRTDKSIERNEALEKVQVACSKLVNEGSAVATPGVKPAPPASPAQAAGQSAWVYLGTYRKGAWETRYLNIPADLDPFKFISTSPGVYIVSRETGALNVRSGEFSHTGDFPPITAVLRSGKPVKILNTWQWFDSGNWWAKVQIL
jgi:hypothetical protein